MSSKSNDKKHQLLYQQLKLIPGMRASEIKALIDAGLTTPLDIIKPPFAILVNNEPKLHVTHLPVPEIKWEVAHAMAKKLPKGMRILGSYRRQRPILHDIDILTCMSINEAEKILSSIFTILGKYTEGDLRSAYIMQVDGINVRVDLFHAEYDELPTALLHFTGSPQFNIRTRKIAKDRGYKLNQYGLFKGNKKIEVKDERDILKKLDISYKEPKDRE
jgi:DNA polymerase/3'-5' exonuclease PolX